MIRCSKYKNEEREEKLYTRTRRQEEKKVIGQGLMKGGKGMGECGHIYVGWLSVFECEYRAGYLYG